MLHNKIRQLEYILFNMDELININIELALFVSKSGRNRNISTNAIQLLEHMCFLNDRWKKIRDNVDHLPLVLIATRRYFFFQLKDQM